MSNPVYYGGVIDKGFMSRSMYERTFRLETRSRLNAKEICDGLTQLIKFEDVIEIGRASATSWNVTVASAEAVDILRAAESITCGTRTHQHLPSGN